MSSVRGVGRRIVVDTPLDFAGVVVIAAFVPKAAAAPAPVPAPALVVAYFFTMDAGAPTVR
jgi:hypothetical protein